MVGVKLWIGVGLGSGIGVWPESVIPLKNPMNASTTLSMNGKFPKISHAPPFVLRLSKDERKVFQQNHIFDSAK